MSNLIPMSGYPVPVRPYSQITPFTYRDNSTYLEILEQIRTWIQNTLVPHLDTEYEELVQSWADNIQLLTTNYETLLADQATTLRGEFVAADDALDSRIDSLTSTVASNDASVRAAFAAADAALQSQITTINSNVAAMNTSIRADFAAADATLQTNINTVNTNTNARIDDIIANSVSAQDSVVAGLVNSNTSLTNTALNNKYATDADMNAANAHLTSVDGSITSLSGRMTTAEGTITSHTSSIATNASAISTTNTNLGTTNSNVSALTTRVTTAEGNITTNTSDINSFKAAAPRTVASASARDALFPSPVPGNTVYRSDLAYEERYYNGEGWKPVKGQILQTVYSAIVTEASNASVTYVDTGLSVSITPKSPTSKLVVIGAQSIGKNDTGASYAVILVKDGATLQFNTKYGGTGSGNYFSESLPITHSVTSGSTAATTFKTQFSRQGGTGNVRAQMDNAISTLQVIEVAA